MLYVAYSTNPVGHIPPPNREGFQLEWVGWDGSVWDLYGAWGEQGGVGITLDDLVGIGMPDFSMYTESSPAMHGAVWRGFSAEIRTVTLPLLLYSDGTSSEWVDLDRAFWASMRPDRPGQLRLKAPGTTEWRSLSARFSKASDAFSHDPSWSGWASYGVTLQCEQPFWTGDPVVQRWVHGEDEPFIDPAGSPPVHIADPVRMDGATMTNPGDLPAWLIWQTLGDGPIDAMTIGVGSRTATLDTPLSDTQRLYLDTDPSRQRILVDGSEVFPSQRPRYAPLPDGTDVPIAISRQGTGTITATLVPRYFRGW